MKKKFMLAFIAVFSIVLSLMTYSSMHTKKKAVNKEMELSFLLRNAEALSQGETNTYYAPLPTGAACCSYVNGLPVNGHESNCYPTTEPGFCTPGICMVDYN